MEFDQVAFITFVDYVVFGMQSFLCIGQLVGGGSLDLFRKASLSPSPTGIM